MTTTCAGDVITVPTTVKVYRYAGGQRQEEMVTELRGTPVNGKAMKWAGSRLLLQRGSKRRSRQHYVIMWSPGGWHSESGSGLSPMGRATCQSFVEYMHNRGPGWQQDFREFHEGHPVEWKVTTTEGRWTATRFYCDPHMPREIRDLTDPT